MKSVVLTSLLALSLFGQSAPAPQTKLVLLIAVDQCRYDYLTKFNAEYKGGLRMLIDRSANFVDGHLEHYPTVTAVGHATMMTGATPAVSGIIGNDWYDRETGKQVTSVLDVNTQLLGGPSKTGASPRRMLVSTVGDELKRASANSKVIGVSLKDRSAILPAGHMADAAYWFSSASGTIVSSTYYFPKLPAWVEKFNSEKLIDTYRDKLWLEKGARGGERRIPSAAGSAMYDSVYSSPYGNNLLTEFVIRTITEEKLGQRGVTDVLTVSYSSHDSVGHDVGPDAPEMVVMARSADETIGQLLNHVDKTVGLKNTIVVLTADHGVAPAPEVLEQQKIPGGRIAKGDFFAPMRAAFEERFGPGQWILATAGSSPYLNHALIREKKLSAEDFRKVAAEAMLDAPHVARVYTREQLLGGRFAADRFDMRVVRSYFPRRSGDLEIILDPFWIRGGTRATHGSPYNYDSHIPILFMGSMFQPGRYYTPAALNDVAPTLASVIDVEIPSGSVGRVLHEAIRGPRADAGTSGNSGE